MFKMGLKKIEDIFQNYNNIKREIENITSSILQMNKSIKLLNEDIEKNSLNHIQLEETLNSNKKILNKITNDIDEMMEKKK